MFVGEGGIAKGSFGEGEEKEEGGKLFLGFGLSGVLTMKISKTYEKFHFVDYEEKPS